MKQKLPRGNVSTLQPYKSQWQLGKTKTIRVPIVLADELLAIAKKLDEGEPITDGSLDALENAINAVLSDPTVTRNGRDGGAVKRALSALKMRLE